MTRLFSIILLLFFPVLIALSFQSSNNLGIGSSAPKIKIKDWLDKVPDLENKVVVVDFWFTTCGPCVASIPHLNNLVDKYKGEDVVFLAVTSDSKATVEKFVERRKLPIKSFVGLNGALERKFGVTHFPQSFIIDGKGIIRWVGSPLLLSTQILNEILNTDVEQLKERVIEINTDIERLSIRQSQDTSQSISKTDYISDNTIRHVELGTTIPEFIAKQKQVSLSRTQAKDQTLFKKYDITYENFASNSNDFSSALVNIVLNAFHVSLEMQTIQVQGLILNIDNLSQLNQSKSQKSGSNMETKNHTLKASSISLRALATRLEQEYGQIIELNDVNNDKFNFNIDLTNLDKTIEALSSNYGLSLRPKTLEVEIYFLNK